jgi:SnoaL-like domain
VLTRVKGVVDMDERDARQVAESLWKALQASDWETAGAYLHDDSMQEWPQSGERITGRDNAIAIEQNFPGGLPTMRFRRTLAGRDLAVLEVELTYADGTRYLGVSILELRDGKVVKETDYYAQPFQAPEWRAQWVEQM